MTGNAQSETRQTRSLESEAFVILLRTADALLREVEGVLKNSGLSQTQYNVLRILRGAGPAGLACREIAGRMITRDPDITRLLDRLEARGLVSRSRERRDRRVVTSRITAQAARLLKQLDEPVSSLHQWQFRHIPARRLRLLVSLLEQARKRDGARPE